MFQFSITLSFINAWHITEIIIFFCLGVNAAFASSQNTSILKWKMIANERLSISRSEYPTSNVPLIVLTHWYTIHLSPTPDPITIHSRQKAKRTIKVPHCKVVRLNYTFTDIYCYCRPTVSEPTIWHKQQSQVFA